MPVLHRKLWRDTRRQWPQFAAIVVTILLGVALFATSYDAYRNLDASYRQLFEKTAFAHLWVTGGDTTAFADAARNQPGVAAVTTRIEADVPMRIAGVELRGRLLSMPDEGRPAINDVVVTAGGLDRDGAAVEQHAAEHFGLAPGATVGVRGPERWQELELAATVASTEFLWPARSRFEVLTPPGDFAVVWARADVAREVAGHGPNQALVRLGAEAGPARLVALEELALGHGATRVLTRDEQPSNSVLQEDINGFSQMSVAFPALFLTAAAMATYVLLTRRVHSERQIIGTLLASGVDRTRILRHYLAYGVTASLVGGVLGVGLGMAFASWLTRIYTSFIDLPLTVVALRAETIGIGLAFALATGAVAAWAPARAAAAVPPAEAMRGAPPVTGGRRTLLERLVPALRRAPASWRLVLRNIARNRRRTVYTMVGTVLALLLVLTSLGMLTSVQAMMTRQFDQVQREDARVELAGGATDEVLAELTEVEGVTAVEPFAEVPVALEHDGASFGTSLRVFPADTAMHGFRAPNGSLGALPSRGILLGHAGADELGVTAGDDVRISSPVLPGGVTVEVAGLVDEPLGTFAYASFGSWRAAAGRQMPTSAALLEVERANASTVRAAVTRLDPVVAYTSTQAVEDRVRDFMGLFYAFVGGMIVLGGIMGFAIIFTTLSVSIVERARDVATLRASGVHPRRIGRLIMGENLLVTLAAVVPGLVVGVLGGRAMLQTFSNPQFSIDFVVPGWTLLVAAATLLLVALASQWPSLRLVQRLPIADIVRERQT